MSGVVDVACIECGAYVSTQYARICESCLEAEGSLVRYSSPNKASLSAEDATKGWCSDCKAGDHGHHRPALGGICIGCACPEQAAS